MDRELERRRKISESKKGHVVSIETRRKISASLKGEKHYWFGKKHSEETKQKMRLAWGNRPRTWVGMPLSKEAREKISNARKGVLFTEEHKRNIGIASLGRVPSLETRQKISIAGKGRSFTIEHRRKIGFAQRGEKSHNWEGGITSLNKMIRHSIEYKFWRTHIFQRDNYTCQDCKIRGGVELHSDHIIPFSFILASYKIKTLEDALKCEFLWDIRNGRTLCILCHKKTNTFGYKAKNYV